MDRQLKVHIQSLPEDLRVLFDGARPLPQDVWFQPRRAEIRTFRSNLLSSGVWGGGLTICLPAFCLIAVAGTLSDGTQRIRDAGDIVAVVVIGLVLVGLLIAGVMAFWKPLWYEWLAVREQRAGTLRRGLFLTPDAMVVRVETNRCDIIPRESIASLSFIRGRVRHWRVYCHAPSGARTDPFGFVEYGLYFPPFDEGDPEPAAIARIREWASIGKNSA